MHVYVDKDYLLPVSIGRGISRITVTIIVYSSTNYISLGPCQKLMSTVKWSYYALVNPSSVEFGSLLMHFIAGICIKKPEVVQSPQASS